MKYRRGEHNIKLEIFPLRKRILIFNVVSNIELEVISNAVSQKIQVRVIKIGKKERELSLFVDYMLIYLKKIR